MQKNTALKLILANNEFKRLGYKLKIFDAYRPLSAQKLLWDATDKKEYVANPSIGSIHNRGAAVDVTLVDQQGNELNMPSEFDEFSEKSHVDYNGATQEQINNRELLGSIMIKYGFERLNNEWWHFNDIEWEKYPILDIKFEEFE